MKAPTPKHVRVSEEVSRLTMQGKRGIWQRKVLEVIGMSEMWWVLKSLTDNNSRIITDNGRVCVSRHQNRTLEVANDTWHFSTSKVRSDLSCLNPSKTAGPDKVHPRLLCHLGSKAVLFLQQPFS